MLEICALSYGFAINTYVGQNYGAGRLDRIRTGMRSAAVLAVLTSLVIAAMMFLFGRQIAMLFISSEDPVQANQAGDIAYAYLKMMAAGLPVLYLLYLLFSALQGLGDTVQPMVSGFVELFFRLTVAGIVAWTGHQTGIFYAEIAAWIGSALYLWYHLAKRMKQ